MKKLIIILAILGACKSKNKIAFTPIFLPGPPTLVYKTKANYNQLVPVILDEDRKEIISYPHPKDVLRNHKLAMPTALAEGYLLDERGIGLQVAFLKLTYEEYAKLEQAPPLAEMYAMIVDKDPLVFLCNCGNGSAFTNKEQQLNALIKAKELTKVCKVLK